VACVSLLLSSFFVVFTEEELEAAFATKNFSQCDALQDTIRDIQAARSKLPLPEVIPETRRELDLMLLEAKYTLDHTVAVHDLVLSAKLELRIQQLESRKSTFCTVEERKVNLKAAVAALDDAMARKEFKRCAQLQQVTDVILHAFCRPPLHLTRPIHYPSALSEASKNTPLTPSIDLLPFATSCHSTIYITHSVTGCRDL
jgi:hypothetical protein